MSNGAFSPVMIIASGGLLENQGLAVNADLGTSFNTYTTLAVIDTWQTVVASAIALGNTVISDNTLTALQVLGANSFPAITNAIPGNVSGIIGNTFSTGFTGYVQSWAHEIMGSGDLSKFAQIYGASQGYRSSANQMINSSKNTASVDATFINMDAITTAGLSLVSQELRSFGGDLEKLGRLISLADLSNLGFPSALIRQILTVGGLLPVVRTGLSQNSISDDVLQDILDDPVAQSASVERNIYRAMTEIKDADLLQVTELLDVTVGNLSTMADLLDPEIILPNSYQSLILVSGGSTVYLYQDTSVNSALLSQLSSEPAYQLLNLVIPPDQALANRALSRSLFQVKKIIELTLPQLASSALAIESNQGLSSITSLSSAVPATTVTNIGNVLTPSDVVQTATGTNGTLTTYDFFGSAAGYPYVANLVSVVLGIENLQAAGDLSTLDDAPGGAYTVMLDTLAGVYGDPTTGPITGVPAPFDAGDPYANADVAFSSTYIPITANLITNVATASPDQTDSVNNAWYNMADQASREEINFSSAQVEFADLQANSRPSIMGLCFNLHEIGTDDSANGPNDLYTAVATSDQTGQAIVASLREGRNILAAESAGIGIDTQLGSR